MALAAVEPALAIFGVEQEALEVPEAIEDQTGDFPSAGVTGFRSRQRYRWPRRWYPIPTGGRSDQGGIAAEGLHATCDLLKVTREDRIPAVGVRNALGDPAQHRQVTLLGQQQSLFVLHRDAQLEGPEDPPPLDLLRVHHHRGGLPMQRDLRRRRWWGSGPAESVGQLPHGNLEYPALVQGGRQ